VFILDITCCGEVKTHKKKLECTLRYLKYSFLLTLMCLIHSFNNIYFDLQHNKQSKNYECGYYVMQWVLTTVRAEIDRCWDHVIFEYKNTLKFGIYYSCTNSNVTILQ